MIVWLNGPFGGGKTQVAHELHRRLPGSVVCDPEQVGYGLHRALPPALRGDFQDLRAWRSGVVEVLGLADAHRDGAVLVPMTVVEPEYLDQTVGELRRRGADVRHVALLARPETVRRRLRGRSLGRPLAAATARTGWAPGESFALANLDRCLHRLRGPEFAEHLRTDDLDVPAVAERAARLCGLDLLPPAGPLRRRAQQRWTALRHVHVR
ncbi:AAA family ATPase [Kineococcus sp. SYSU DK005]|uniref:AAA family ATPase n=1 Tax=Kineococcus sp. SYSU DK005 TaxID=3383126 RepID=UPI003D7EAC7F